MFPIVDFVLVATLFVGFLRIVLIISIYHMQLLSPQVGTQYGCVVLSFLISAFFFVGS